MGAAGYNQDLDGCLGGGTGFTPVLVTSTQIVPASNANNRRSVTLINRDATNPIYYAFGGPNGSPVSAATTSNASLQAGEAISLAVRGAVYGIATGGTVRTEWIVEEDN